MRKLTVYLDEKAIDNGEVNFTLKEIARMVEDGYNRGIETPVNWTLTDADPYDLDRLDPEQKRILTKQVLKLIEDQDLVNQILNKASEAYDSGALDTDRIRKDDYEIPKLVLIAAFQSLANSFTPICEHCQAEIVKLQKYI